MTQSLSNALIYSAVVGTAGSLYAMVEKVSVRATVTTAVVATFANSYLYYQYEKEKISINTYKILCTAMNFTTIVAARKLDLISRNALAFYTTLFITRWAITFVAKYLDG